MAAPIRLLSRMFSHQKSLFTPFPAVSPQLDYNIRHFHRSSICFIPRKGGRTSDSIENDGNVEGSFEGEGGNHGYDMFSDAGGHFSNDREVESYRGRHQKRFSSQVDTRPSSDDTLSYPVERDHQTFDKPRKKKGRKPQFETLDKHVRRGHKTKFTADNVQVSYDEPGEKWWKHREFEKVQPGDDEHHTFETRIEQLVREQKEQRREEREYKKSQKNKEGKPETAKDIVKRLREEQWAEEIATGRGLKDIQELDLSKEKFLYRWKHQVADLSRVSPHTLASILRKSLLYDEGDIVAIEKPYGVPVHGGPGMGISIADALPILQKSLKTERLYLVHRLDKETTGVMLLAKTDDMARQLHSLFRLRKVIKKYWVLTMGVPSHEEGVLDIPIKETEVTAQGRPHYRMVCVPEFSEETKLLVRKKRKSTDAQVAVTNFRVLDSSGSCALVECQPETGVKHQIRSHMSYGLDCPILGDHKYSNHSKLAPQRLPTGMLERLGIEQPKARYLPMHLHARQIILPGFKDGRSLYFTARLPDFFHRNMKKLRIRAPKGFK
ncbi:RPUSD4 [Branchiostoma lanceolatum]|uniref:Pseudouridylate synthase RPUSD4, mitochondrial n=1 Tax=Branchiostoma lanceolatum TaxID=7740 RepID=A0A8J9YRH5_BRALA|nr:RPUSD4 [Branchiostoma lanceolatum]